MIFQRILDITEPRSRIESEKKWAENGSLWNTTYDEVEYEEMVCFSETACLRKLTYEENHDRQESSNPNQFLRRDSRIE